MKYLKQIKIVNQDLHQSYLKDFVEEVAISKKCNFIFHYCRIDNFRMYSLNESHGYKKTDRKLGPNSQVVEWVKTLKK